MLVAHDGADEQIARALTAHGLCWLALVVALLVSDPLDLPAFVSIPAGIMACAWGTAWTVIGRGYGLRGAATATRRRPDARRHDATARFRAASARTRSRTGRR
jgi:hypothetical protein